MAREVGRPSVDAARVDQKKKKSRREDEGNARGRRDERRPRGFTRPSSVRAPGDSKKPWLFDESRPSGRVKGGGGEWGRSGAWDPSDGPPGLADEGGGEGEVRRPPRSSLLPVGRQKGRKGGRTVARGTRGASSSSFSSSSERETRPGGRDDDTLGCSGRCATKGCLRKSGARSGRDRRKRIRATGVTVRPALSVGLPWGRGSRTPLGQGRGKG